MSPEPRCNATIRLRKIVGTWRCYLPEDHPIHDLNTPEKRFAHSPHRFVPEETSE